MNNDIFCERCDNILDITSSIQKDYNADSIIESITDTESNKPFVDYENILKNLEKNKPVSNDVLKNIDIKDLVKNEYYKKMNKKGDVKKQIIDMIQDLDNSDNDVHSFLVCKNCLFTKPMKTQMKILTKKPENVVVMHDYVNESFYRNRLHISSMPCTRNFKCPNNACSVYTKNKPNEAIFFRKNQQSYDIVYICKNCGTIKMN